MEQNKNSKALVVTGFMWRLLERIGAQGVQLVVSLVLARILAPELFGKVAIISVFIAVLNVFIDSGLGNALIQKKDADDLDFSTVFYFNIAVCSLLYIGMLFAAPFIAAFYELPELVGPIRVISLLLVISGVKNVQQAYVSRTMQFKRFFFATLGGTIGAAVLGIWMALSGYGIWALIAQSLFNSTVDTVILWITVKWRPKKMFSFERLKRLFAYGWKLLVSSLFDTVYNKLRELIIGKLYTPTNLAFYERGNHIPAVLINNVNLSISSVLFPAMSAEQDDKERLRNITRRSIKISSYVMWPMMMGLSACAETIISVILTDKWLPCVPFMRIFCIAYAFNPIHTANLSAINAMGRSDIFLKLEFIKKGVGLFLLLVTVRHGVMAMTYSLLVSTFTSQLINSWPNRKLLNYRYEEQIRDILPSIILSAAMFAVVWPIRLLTFPKIVILVIQIIAGVIIYVGGSAVFRIDSFTYILALLKELLKKK